MSGLGDMAPTDEAAPWQSPPGSRARLAAGARYANPTRGERRVALMGVVVAVILLFVGIMDIKETGGFPVLLILASVATLAWMFGFLSLYLGYNRVSQITLTEREVSHAIGFPWPRHETIARADVRSAVVYEGDGTVLLLGEAGELLRTRHLDGAAAFAEALGVPAMVWSVRVGVDPPLWNIYTSPFIVAAAVPMYFVAVYPGALLGIGVLILLSSIIDLSGSNSGMLGCLFIMMPVVLVTFVLAVPPALFLSIAAGRFLFKPDTLHGYLHAMCGEPSNADGRAPSSRPGRWARLTARYTLWCARIVGVEAPPEPQPDLRGGMTPEMAAEALALAEGTG